MKQFSFAVLCICLFASCKTKKPVILDDRDPGWLAFNYPRTNWPPGFVFRVKDGEEVPQEVTTLRSTKALDTGYAFLPGKYEKKTFNAKGFLKFLFLNPNDSTIKANSNKKIEI